MVSYWIRARLEGSRMDEKLMKQFNYEVAKDQKIKLLAKKNMQILETELGNEKRLMCIQLSIYVSIGG